MPSSPPLAGHFDLAIRAQTRALDAQLSELKEEAREREKVRNVVVPHGIDAPHYV
jgi:hypothetical protein